MYLLTAMSLVMIVALSGAVSFLVAAILTGVTGAGDLWLLFKICWAFLGLGGIVALFWAQVS
ncbi:hypothetical protein [Falsirhodobacter deserti]|uniref:hypothetical protein n=1 Tax=Falsirhodobacter deserti TaxID=1365611 RepID=UPI000FE42389|nr:hypothetical protein [Falsirhodobacter deserti]